MTSEGKEKDKDSLGDRGFMHDVHKELAASKQSVKELLRLRQSLFKDNTGAEGRIKECRDKAIDAINHLFEDDVKD